MTEKEKVSKKKEQASKKDSDLEKEILESEESSELEDVIDKKNTFLDENKFIESLQLLSEESAPVLEQIAVASEGGENPTGLEDLRDIKNISGIGGDKKEDETKYIEGATYQSDNGNKYAAGSGSGQVTQRVEQIDAVTAQINMGPNLSQAGQMRSEMGAWGSERGGGAEQYEIKTFAEKVNIEEAGKGQIGEIKKYTPDKKSY